MSSYRLRAAALTAACLAALVARAAAQEPLRPVGDEAWGAMVRWFDYAPAPPATRLDELRETANGRVIKMVFDGAGGRRVPALLELPLHAEPPYPCVLLIHGMSRAKEHWWSFGTTTEGKHKDRLVAEGYAVLGLDLPLHGERAAENGYVDPGELLRHGADPRLRELFVASVVDHRRAIDALWAQARVDSARIGVLGYGYGGAVAFALAAVEPRVRTTVACVPPTERDRLSLWATQNYAPRIRTPFLLLMAANSRTSSADDGARLRAGLSASPAAELKVYTSDDRLPIWYVGDAVAWFGAHLR